MTSSPTLRAPQLLLILTASLSGLLAGPGLAAASPGQVEAPSSDPLVFNGAMVGTCQWPQTVSFQLCSGMLIHPEIALIGAQCIDALQPTEILFGERNDLIQRTAAIDHCMIDPNANTELGYCKLAEPITDMPITPIAHGCALDELEAGRPLILTGFGYDQTQHGGTKRWAELPLSETLEANTHSFVLGEGDVMPCVGDAGVYAELSDGTWRTVAYLVDGALSCGSEPGLAKPAYRGVNFIEDNSGVDITPCTDPDGTWNPGPECGGFALDPLANDGSWDSWCAGEVSGPSSLCGPAYGEPADTTAPSVSVLAPTDGTAYAEAQVEVDIELEVADAESKIRRVSLWIDGDLILFGLEPPYLIPGLMFPAGEYELSARAEDWSGNIGESAPVTLIVGQDGPSEGETGAGETDGGETDGGGDPGGAEAGSPGCRTSLSPTSPGGAVPWLLALLGLGWLRRRDSD